MKSLSIQEQKEVTRLLDNNELCDLLIYSNYLVDEKGSLEGLKTGFETVEPYITNKISEKQRKGLLDILGMANTLMLNLNDAKDYFVQSGNKQKLVEVFELAQTYGNYPVVKELIKYGKQNNVKELSLNGNYADFLMNDCLLKMRLQRNGDEFSLNEDLLSSIVNDIVRNNGTKKGDEHLIFGKALQKLEKGGCRNIPKKYIFAMLTGDQECAAYYKKKYQSKCEPIRDHLDEIVNTYLKNHSMKLIQKMQEGDKADFFPIASNLYLVEEGKKQFVLKEHLRLYVDFSRINGYTNEKSILSKLDHPNIIKCVDSLTIGGIDFLKIEYFKSKSLAEYTENRRTMPVKEAVHIIKKLSEVLEYLQGRNILYMDIKDKNVMYNGKDVKLLDFGMAQASDKPVGDDQYATSLISTPKYVTPEGGTRNRAYKKSDVFQLGILFYELLTGKHPYASERYNLIEGDSHRESEVIKYSLPNICKQYDTSPDILHTLPEIGGIVERMLSQDYKKRPSPGELTKLLEDLKIK